ncbi:MAG: hypothetical protein ACMUIA_08465 [bacterium]
MWSTPASTVTANRYDSLLSPYTAPSRLLLSPASHIPSIYRPWCPGSYQGRDYVRPGLPLVILTFILTLRNQNRQAFIWN